MTTKTNSVKRSVINIVLAVVIYFGVINLGEFLMAGTLKKMFSDSLTITTIPQIYEAIVACVLVFVFKKKDSLKGNLKGIGEGIICGAAIIAINGIMPLAIQISDLMGQTISVSKIVIALVFCIFIGISEEAIFRGIVTEYCLDIFGTKTQKARMLSVIVPSVIFGAVHLMNAVSPDISFATAAVQAMVAGSLGLAFGAVYYRSGRSIWAGVIIHAIVDFAGLAAKGMLTGATASEAVGNLGLGGIILVPVYITIFLCVMRSEKTA